MPEQEVFLTGLGIPESPRWHEGRLWFCNWIDRQVMAVGLYDITLYSMELAQDAYIQGDLPGVLAESAAKNYAVLVDTAGFYGISGNTGCLGFSNEVGVQLRKYGAGGASSNTPHTGTAGTAIADTQEPSTLMEIVRAKSVEPTGFATSPQLAGTFNVAIHVG